MAQIRFYNAYICRERDAALQPVQITVENGVITAVSHDPSPLPAAQEIDCGGAVLLPGLIDAHLHLPGSLLYQRHGVNLMGSQSLADYQALLCRHKDDRSALRGFGWNQSVFQDDPSALPSLQAFLNETFPSLPVALFSDDYHSCICNRALLDAAAAFLPAAYYDNATGLLKERAVFSLLHNYPALSFRPEEIEDALLAYQDLLLRRGVTAVQTLMPIGMTETDCFHALQALEARGLWKLHVNFSVTAHPTDAPADILQKYRVLETQQSALLHLHTVKIYIDGVVDNGSAYLSAPYENSPDRGTPIWTDAALQAFCTLFDRENIQIHAHVIGDAAAAQITSILDRAMAENGRLHNENRHVLAHLQLLDEATAAQIARLSLLCVLQPFWFPQDAVYPVDRVMLGARADTEYPCGSLLRRGAGVAFGSDSPVTPDPSPLLGIACAMERTEQTERLTLAQALRAYTRAGAYQLFSEGEAGRIAPGYRADFLLLRTPQPWNTPAALTAATVEQTYIGGKCVYNKTIGEDDIL